MYCSGCGSRIEDQSAFCPKCGKSTGNGYGYGNENRRGQNQSFIESRNIGICVLLSIVTCGIYGIIWFIYMVDDLNKVSDSSPDEMSGGMVFLLSLVTCGIYSCFWFYKAADKVNVLKRKQGLPMDTSLNVLYLLLGIFGLSIVNYCLIQNELNNYMLNA